MTLVLFQFVSLLDTIARRTRGLAHVTSALHFCWDLIYKIPFLVVALIFHMV